MANKVTAFLTGAAMMLTLGVMPAATAMAAEYGDVNLDGKVSIVDVIMANKAILGAETLSDEQRIVGDVDGNGKVTPEDSLTILKFLVDLVDDLTPETTAPTEPTTTAAPETTTVPATTVATETDPVEPETTEAPVTTTTAEETTTAEAPETTEATETTTTADMTTTKASETTTTAEMTTTEAPETTTEAPETTTTAEETTTEAPATTTEGIASEYAEVRETGIDADGNKILDVSNATKVEIAVTGGESNAGMNGCFGYMADEWTNLKWEITLDEEGNGVAYVDVPEGQTSLQFQVWYYSGASQDAMTFVFTVERDPDTVLTGVTEVRDLVDGELDVTGAAKVEMVITGGIAGANINGGYGYTDPEIGWTDPMPTWGGSFNAEGELTIYLTVPEGVTSFQMHTWYYGLGDDTYDTADLTTVYTVQLVEAAE